MGSVDGADHGKYFCRQRECGYFATLREGQLPQVPSAYTRCSRCNLLLQLENIHKFRSQEYGTNFSGDGCCFSRRI